MHLGQLIEILESDDFSAGADLNTITRCRDEPVTQAPVFGQRVYDQGGHFQNNVGAEAKEILLIHQSPVTDALLLLVSKSDEVTTT